MTTKEKAKKEDPLKRATARLRASMEAFAEADQPDEETSPDASESPAKRLVRLKKILNNSHRAHRAKPWGLLFLRWDRDHSGDTSFDEFLAVMREGARITETELSDEDLQFIFDSADSDNDGVLQYRKEFLPWLQANHSKAAREEEAGEDGLGHSEIDASMAPAQISDRKVAAVKKKLTDLTRLHASKPWPLLFRRYDRDESGDISFDEFLLVVREGAFITEKELSDEELHLLFYSADKQHDGVIEWEKEFLPFLNVDHKERKDKHHGEDKDNLAEELCKQLQSKLRSATMGISLHKFFKRFDKDRSGSLNMGELRHLVRAELHIPLTMMSDKDIETLVTALDDDGSGTLSIEELVEFIELGSGTFNHAESEEEMKHIHEQRKRALIEKKERRRELMREWALKQEWHCPRCNFLNNDPAECDLCGCERPAPSPHKKKPLSQSQALSARLAPKTIAEALKERLPQAALTSTGLLPTNKYTKQAAVRSRLKIVRQRVDPDHMLTITSSSHQHDPVHTYSHLFVEDSDDSDTKKPDDLQSPKKRNTRSLSPTKKKASTPEEKQKVVQEELQASSVKIFERGCERLFAGQHELAVAEFAKAIRANPKNLAAWSHRALAFIGVGNYTAAIHDCTNAIELDWQSASVYSTRGVARAQSQDFQGALLDFESALKLDPQDVATWHSLGALKYFMGDPAGAVNDCTQALKHTPGDGLAYVNRAAAKIQMCRFKGAKKDCDAAVYLNPDDAVAYGHRGEANLMLSDFSGAVKDLDRCLDLAPGDVTAMVLRGRAKERLGELDSANKDLTKALHHDHQHLAALVYRSHVYARMGDKDFAREDFELALSLDPTLPKVTETEESEQEPAVEDIPESEKESKNPVTGDRSISMEPMAIDAQGKRQSLIQFQEDAESSDAEEAETQETLEINLESLANDDSQQGSPDKGGLELIVRQAAAAVEAIEKRKWTSTARRDSFRGSMLQLATSNATADANAKARDKNSMGKTLSSGKMGRTATSSPKAESKDHKDPSTKNTKCPTPIIRGHPPLLHVEEPLPEPVPSPPPTPPDTEAWQAVEADAAAEGSTANAAPRSSMRRSASRTSARVTITETPQQRASSLGRSSARIANSPASSQASPSSPARRSKAVDKRRLLRVTMESARNLKKTDWFGKSDPYCICVVPGKPHTKVQTEVVHKNLNPVWNHQATLTDYAEGDSLEFSVWDKEKMTKDELLGKVILDSSQIGSGFSGEVKLLETGKSTSFLTVSVAFLEAAPSPGKQRPSSAGAAISHQGASSPPRKSQRRMTLKADEKVGEMRTSRSHLAVPSPGASAGRASSMGPRVSNAHGSGAKTAEGSHHVGKFHKEDKKTPEDSEKLKHGAKSHQVGRVHKEEKDLEECGKVRKLKSLHAKQKFMDISSTQGLGRIFGRKVEAVETSHGMVRVKSIPRTDRRGSIEQHQRFSHSGNSATADEEEEELSDARDLSD